MLFEDKLRLKNYAWANCFAFKTDGGLNVFQYTTQRALGILSMSAFS